MIISKLEEIMKTKLLIIYVLFTIINTSYSFKVSGFTNNDPANAQDYENPANRIDQTIKYAFRHQLHAIDLWVSKPMYDECKALNQTLDFTADILPATTAAKDEWENKLGYFKFNVFEGTTSIQNDVVLSDLKHEIIFCKDGFFLGQAINGLAQTLIITEPSGRIYGDIMFNCNYVLSTTTMDESNNIIDYQSVLTHEIGHLLGANHSELNRGDLQSDEELPTMADASNIFNGIMHTTTCVRTLANDDINCMKFLYHNLYVPEVYSDIHMVNQISLGYQHVWILDIQGFFTYPQEIFRDNIYIHIRDGSKLLPTSALSLECGTNGFIELSNAVTNPYCITVRRDINYPYLFPGHICAIYSLLQCKQSSNFTEDDTWEFNICTKTN